MEKLKYPNYYFIFEWSGENIEKEKKKNFLNFFSMQSLTRFVSNESEDLQQFKWIKKYHNWSENENYRKKIRVLCKKKIKAGGNNKMTVWFLIIKMKMMINYLKNSNKWFVKIKLQHPEI